MVRHISSGSTFEQEIGYSRAVVDEHYVFVSGTTGMDYATMTLADGVLDQTTQCLQNIKDVLEEAGSSLDKVVRVCYYLPDRSDFEACWPALREAFSVAKPAATMIETCLMNDDMKIEIEVTAKR
ncbi:MAG: RidA family protein [Sneathiella sp.]|nr:RidA family protein [Sneathiella sp.]